MLSDTDIQRIAVLSRLRIEPHDMGPTREKLQTVVAYIEQLQKLDVAGIEPLAHVGDAFNRLDDDTPRQGGAMPREQLIAIAPAIFEADGQVFVQMPKVIKPKGDGA